MGKRHKWNNPNKRLFNLNEKENNKDLKDIKILNIYYMAQNLFQKSAPELI